MKKKVILSSTAWWAFWVELPLIALLVWAICVNGAVEGALKLYPLILVVVVSIVFVAVFLIRLVELTYSEIKTIGRFSSRDSAIINEGKRLNLKLLERGRVSIMLIGRDDTPGIDWMTDDGRAPELPLFRGKVYGGKGAIKSVLKYFGIKSDDIASILSQKRFSQSYQDFSIYTEHPEDGLEVNIHFDKTIDSVKTLA